MNKIFKIVWSKSRQCYIVVSEYAKNTSGKKAVAMALVAFSVLAGSSAVQAAPPGGSGGQSAFWVGPRASASGLNSQAVGVDAHATGAKSIAMGSDAEANHGSGSAPAMAVGAQSHATAGGTTALGFNSAATQNNGIALGNSAYSGGADTIAIGYMSGMNSGAGEGSQNGSSANGGVYIGKWAGKDVKNGNDNNVAIGTNADVSKNDTSGGNRVAIGNGAQAQQVNSTAVGTEAKATGISSAAFGQKANATASYALAAGYGTQATGVYTSALGYNASATANNATAVGVNSTAGGGAFAGGNGAQATGNNSVAVGNGAQSSDGSATAVGDGAKATGYQSSAIGNGAKASRSNALAVGTSATATEIYASAFGSGASAAGSYGTAIGTNAKANTGSGTAVGGNANAEGDGSTAIGGANTPAAQTVTIAGNTVSLTKSAYAKGQQSLAVGYQTQALGADSVAVGTTAVAGNGGNVAVGHNTISKGLNTVTLGRDLAANGAQSAAIGSSSSASGQFALAIGTGYAGGNPATPSSYGANASGNSSIAIGRSTQATALGATAIGGAQDDSALGAKASGVYATAIGGLSEASGAGSLALGSNNNGFGARATGEKAIAVGAAATASGARSVVVGVNSSATGTDAQAIGNSASVVSNYGTALGTFAKVESGAERGIAIGNSDQSSTATTVKVADGIALGSYSVADRGAGKSGYNMTAGRYHTYPGASGAFTSGLGSLAIGTGQKTRQITGVAAGNDDTDAVNVAQLRSVSSNVKAYNENSANGTGDYRLANQVLVAKSTDKDKLEIQALNTNEGAMLTFTPKTTAVIQNGKSLVTAGDVYTAIDAAKTHYVSVKSTENNNRDNNGANGLNSVAIGGAVGVSGDESIGIGHSITGNSDGAQSVLLGSQIMNLNRESVLIGQNLFNKGTNNILIGKGIEAKDLSASNNVVLGNGATLSGAQAVLIGKGTGSYGASTVTIGDGTTAGTQAHPSAGAVTIGKGAKSYGASAVTIGDGASVGTVTQAVTNSVAIGKGAKSYGASAVTIGDGASVSADNGVAIGNGTSVTAIDGVAIGNSSMANRAPGVTGYDANDNKTDKYAGLTGRAIMSNHGAVSIGGNGFSRQIIGVSAGSADTDAVNVAQLKSVNLGFAGNTGTSDVNLAQSTLGIKGDNTYIKTSAVGRNLTITPNIQNITMNGTTASAGTGLADANNVASAINTAVNSAGWKIKAMGSGLGVRTGDTTETRIGNNDSVLLQAGDNLVINKTGSRFTYSLNPVLNNLTKAMFTSGSDVTTIDANSITMTSSGISLTNSGINAGNKVISNVASGGTTATNAANIGDVQNAVANLSQNLTVTDGTNSGTVNLKNQSLKVAGANGITTNMNGQTLTVGLDSTTNNKVNDTATAVGRTISLGGDTGTTTAKSLTTGDVNFGIKSGNGYLTTAANGNDVTLTVNEGAVKDAAVSAVTVSTDAATDNPVTITPTTGTNSKDYKITVDTSKLAQKTNLAYTADNGTGSTTSLSQGLTFKDGTLTTATAGANGTITYDVKKGTLANTGGTVSVTGNDGVATAQNVADMINNATTSVSTLNIADGGTGTGSVNLKNQTLKVTGSNGLTTTASGRVIDVALDATTKNKIDNAADKDLSNLSTTGTQKIKDAAAFKVKANGDAGDDVKGGDEVNFKDGQNIKVSRTGKEFTIATADDVSFNKVTAADSVLVGTGTNLITLDGTTGTVTGNIFKAGSVNVNGANNTVTGLSNTTWSGTPVSGRAATEDQLKQVADDARAAAGSSKTVVTANSGEGANSTTGNISLTSTTAANGQVTYDVKLADKVTVGTAGNAVTVDGTTGKVTAKDGDFSNKVTVGTGSNKVTVDGADGSVTANTVKAGNVTVNGSNNTITGLSNTTWSGTTTTPDRAATEGQLKQVADAAKSAVDNVTMKYDGDNGGTQTLALKNGTFNVNGDGQFTETTANATGIQVKVKEAAVKDAAVSAVTVSTDTSNPNNPITVTATPGSHSMDYKVTFDGTKAAQSTNLSYKANGGSAETVSLSTGLNFKDGNLTTASVAPNGDVKYDVKTATIAVNNGMAGLNGNDGVATAQNVVDAMNAISHQTTGGLERVVNRIGAVESEGRRVAAQSAALAALKPIQYDPLEPNQIMAGIGNYRGETAAAVGLAHYANEDTMLHMGVALGDNNNMVNVGVTHKFGSAAKKAAIPDRYKAGPISSVYVMQDEVTQLRAENAQQKATLTKQQEEIDALKAAVAQLMAKQ